jgi:riboflavin synthase
MQLGDSVAVNGACLTVVSFEQNIGTFDVSLESLTKTTIAEWQTQQAVNLELALSLSTPLGGHLVTGHVDGLGQLDAIIDQGDATEMQFRIPASLARYIATKGSVCINGVSLTTNRIVEDKPNYSVFTVTLVPHTLQVTSLGQLNKGDAVHIEIDVIARYLDRMRSYDAADK